MCTLVSNGLYKLNQIGIEFLIQNRCQIVNNLEINKYDSRPMYYAMKSDKDENVLYLLPLTTIRSKSQENRIDSCLMSKGIQKYYYEKVKILGVQRVVKISSVFAVSINMIEEWTINGTIYVVKNRNKIVSIQKKLKVMLSHYASNSSHSENHVIELRNQLINKNR